MIYHVDLTEYYELNNIINETLTLANETCSHLSAAEMCSTHIVQLQAQLHHAMLDDINMGAMRQKRGLCNWCGKIQSFTYGVMTEEQGKEVVDFLNNFGNETQNLHDLMLNQTTLFQTSLKVNRENMNKVQTGLNKITNELTETRKEFIFSEHYISTREKTLALTQIASNALTEHLRLYSQIGRAITDTRNHHIPELIAPETLQRDLRTISATLKPSQRLPTDLTRESVLHVFQYAEIKALLIENKLLIQILVPIAETEQYQLFRSTPIPIQTSYGRVILQSSSSHFLLNIDKTRYIEISQHDLDNAKMPTTGEILFRPSNSIQLKYESNCIWRMLVENNIDSSMNTCKYQPFAQNDVIITIIENERYFMASINGTTIWEICDDQQQQHVITGMKIISLDPECYLKTTAFILKPHLTRVFNQTKSVDLNLAASNISIQTLTNLAHESFANVNFTDSPPIIIQNPEQMRELIDSTAEMVQKADHQFKFEKIKLQTNDLFQNFALDLKGFAWLSTSILSTIVFLAFAAMTVFVFIKLRAFTLIAKHFGFSPKAKRGDIVIDLREPPSPLPGYKDYPRTPHPQPRAPHMDTSDNQWNQLNQEQV